MLNKKTETLGIKKPYHATGIALAIFGILAIILILAFSIISNTSFKPVYDVQYDVYYEYQEDNCYHIWYNDKELVMNREPKVVYAPNEAWKNKFEYILTAYDVFGIDHAEKLEYRLALTINAEAELI